MTEILHNLSVWLESSKYILLFVGAIVEGPVLMVASGFLIRLGQFDLVPAYFALLAGDFVADLVWYAVGYHGAGPLIRRFGKYINVTQEILEKIEKRFKTYQNWILFISKITMGFGFALATLIVAGMLRVSLKQYALLNFLGGFIWTAILLTVGFFFGNVYYLIAESFRLAFVILLAVAVIMGLWLLNRYLTKTEI